MLKNFFSSLKELFSCYFMDEHTKWLIRRLPVMMEFDDPNLFNLVEYQKEALLVLVASAYKTQKAFEQYSKNPNNSDLEGRYQSLRNIYTYDVETLRQAHPVFKDLEIHWSKLSIFIRKWQEKKPTTWDRRTTEQIGLLELEIE